MNKLIILAQLVAIIAYLQSARATTSWTGSFRVKSTKVVKLDACSNITINNPNTKKVAQSVQMTVQMWGINKVYNISRYSSNQTYSKGGYKRYDIRGNNVINPLVNSTFKICYQPMNVNVTFNATATVRLFDVLNGWSNNTNTTTSTSVATSTSTVATSTSTPAPTTTPVSNSTDPFVDKLNNGKVVVGYWGQTVSKTEKGLTSYCDRTEYDVIHVSFLNVFKYGSNPPLAMNLGGHCWSTFNGASHLLNCPSIGNEIKYCQSKGKKIMLSIGGAIASVGFKSAQDANTIANAVWNVFLGGSSSFRTFGSAVMDGVDMDIENGAPGYYDVFMNNLKALMDADKSKKYYISGAPQCWKPDVLDPSGWKNGWVDWLNIQFYNNDCGLQHFSTSAWNFNVWASWRDNISINKKARLIIGAPAGPTAAGTGYVTIPTLKNIAQATKAKYPTHFGGISLWDVGFSDATSPTYAAQIRAFL